MKNSKHAMTPKKALERFQKLKAERSLWETHWQECMDYMLPRKNDVVNPLVSPGQKKGVLVLDSTGMDSAELLAGALHGLLTNPNGEWFELTTGDKALDDDDEVRLWLQDSTTRMHNELNNSNFQTEVHEMYLDLVVPGTAIMSMDEDDEGESCVVFSTRPISECYLDEDHRGRIVEIHRLFKWNARQCAAEFGEENLSPKIKKALHDGSDDKFEILHCVSKPAYLMGMQKSQFKYISCYYAVQESELLREKGYYEWPYLTPRWTKISGEKYGRSPAMKALPEVKTLNVMTETTIRGAQKVVDPPLQMPDDGFLGQLVTKPGGINYYRAGTEDRIIPILNDSRVDFGFQAIELKQRKIRDCFYVDQLRLQQSGPQMTATEVMQRTEESMRLLGPMLGRMQSEFLRLLIDRLFGIMWRRGKLLPPPAILQGRTIDVRYSSLIAKSQRLAEGQNMLRTIQAAEPFIMADQAVVDNFDGDKALKVLARIYGFPQEVLRKQEAVAEIRKSRAEAQAQAVKQQQEMMRTDQAAKMMTMAKSGQGKAQ